MNLAYQTTLVLLLVASATALKCMECQDCKKLIGNPQNCQGSENTCMKVEVGKHVIRGCTEKNACGLGKAQRAANRAWTSIFNKFKSKTTMAKDGHVIYCCNKDYCNTALKALPTIGILLIPSLIVALFYF